jgi:hypothetical protein
VQLETAREAGAHLVYVRGRLPPPYLGLILGEVVHDLRSALDQVAWALAEQHAGAELENPRVARAISFPITSSSEAFDSHPARPYLAPEAWAAIAPAQPFQNAGTPRVNPLAIVQEWSNTDKHRVLRPTMGQLRTDDMAFRSSVPIDLNTDVEMLVPSSTLLDNAKPLFRIAAPEHAIIEFRAPPVYVVFASLVRDPPDPFFPEQLDTLVTQVAEVVDDLSRFFEATDWALRVDAWVTPELPG